MRFVAAASFVLVLQPATPPPNTDIFLASLSNEAGALTVAPLGLHGVTRMAVSPSGDRIAFVTQ
jgi:hypothetical protein